MARLRKNAEEEAWGAAIQAAAEEDLGTHVDTLPLQKHGFSGSFKDTGDFVFRFQHGFVDVPAGFPPAAMRFDQIAGVYQAFLRHYVNHAYMRSTYWFTISPLTGESIDWTGEFWDRQVDRRLRGDPGLPEFCRQLAEDVSQARLPAALQALAHGESQSFGSIVISAPGVSGKSGVVPWSTVAPLKFKDGMAHVFQHGQQGAVASTTMGSIPNVPLFLTLFERLRKARKQSP